MAFVYRDVLSRQTRNPPQARQDIQLPTQLESHRSRGPFSGQIFYHSIRPSCSESSSNLGLFKAAIEAMTSEGASKCQVAKVRFELAPTVTAKTCSWGSLVFSSARNMSGRTLASVEPGQRQGASYLHRFDHHQDREQNREVHPPGT